MKVYKYKNATIYIHGEVNKERLKKATIELVKNTQKCKMLRKRCD